MDSSSFDRLTRLLATARSRRTLGATLLGALTGLFALGETDAAPCPPNKKRCRGECIPKARCCTTAQCRPGATGRVCRNGRCVCPPGRPKKCRGRCIPRAQCCGVNFQTNPLHCGRCNHACPNGGVAANVVSCVNGKCRLTREFAAPGEFSFTAPLAGTMTLVVRGGAGGNGGDGQGFSGVLLGGAGGPGAFGTKVTHTLAVAVGQDFLLSVGGAGANGVDGGDGGAGGFNASDGIDGAAGPSGTVGGGGGGGGGYSAVARPPGGVGDILVLAAGAGGGGGGGGGGASDLSSQTGGAGGGGGTSDINGGVPASGGAGGDSTNGFNGEPGEPGIPGDGFPPGPGVQLNENPGSGRVTITITAP